MIVLKFGGSSVDGAAGISRVAALIRDRLPRRPVVVVSAMAKTTRRLNAAAEAAARGDLAAAQAIAAEIETLHRREAQPVTAPGSLEAVFAAHFAALGAALEAIAQAGEVSRRAEDLVAAFGELLASAVLTAALAQAGVAARWIDCRQVIVTDDNFTRARPDYAATDARLRLAVAPLLAAGEVAVLGGYVGATCDGVTTTLGKEGSDFSAAIVGAALGAHEVQIWTDVDGILTADPHLVPAARVVPFLSFAEALELACAGSKKPHPGTLEPASRCGVPIRILNSRNPAAPGSVIGHGRAAHPGPAIRSIACRTADYPLFASPGMPVESLESVSPGEALISLVSEDLAASAELAARTLAVAGGFTAPGTIGGVPRLLLPPQSAAPVVRFRVAAAAAPRVIAELHARLELGG